MFGKLYGKRILVIEDDYLQASDLSLALEHQGGDVVGPYPDLEEGMIALGKADIDAAVLDIKLGSDMVFYLADRLQRRQVPFLFVTGCDMSEIPDRFLNVHRLSKPVNLDDMTSALASTVEAR